MGNHFLTWVYGFNSSWDMKITARYKRTAAHACDLERPFADSDIGVFICHYQGFVRQPRNP